MDTSTGAARTVMEAERRAAKVVMNFIVNGSVFVRGEEEVEVGGGSGLEVAVKR